MSPGIARGRNSTGSLGRDRGLDPVYKEDSKDAHAPAVELEAIKDGALEPPRLNAFGQCQTFAEKGSHVLTVGCRFVRGITQGFTALHVAARCGRLSVLRTLLDAGVPVDHVSTPGLITPLHLAAGFSRVRCVEELLKRGADPSRRNSRGMTPLDLVGCMSPAHRPDTRDPSFLGHSRHGALGDSCSHGYRGQSPDVSDIAAAAASEGERGMRVRQALEKARRWQRRRQVVLILVMLRAKANGSKVITSASSRSGNDYFLPQAQRAKRSRQQPVDVDRRGGLSIEGVDVIGPENIVLRLCTLPDPFLMRHVIKFL